MNGLELSLAFYHEHGAPMLHRQFPEIEPLVAIGLAGSGSECFGYDDIFSQDHDFEPAFCLFLPNEDLVDRRTAFALERAYAKLPKEFMGFSRSPLSPVGGNRHGVIRMSDFFTSKTGSPDGSLSTMDWLSLPEQSLAEAINGAVFRDDLGQFTAIRQKLSYLPEDVRLKKLAGHLLLMGQAGQYNFGRCLARGERAAAQLALNEFVKSTLHVIFLLNRHYLPYYKWSFRALRELSLLSFLDKDLEILLYGQGEKDLIEKIANEITSELQTQGLTSYEGIELEGHAYSVNDRIEEPMTRNLHILFAT